MMGCLIIQQWGSCDDLDAVDLFVETSFYTNYRKNDIEKVLEKHTSQF